jgi:hypothetical protein
LQENTMLPLPETRTRSLPIAAALVAMGHQPTRVIRKEDGEFQIAFPSSARDDHNKLHQCRSFIEALLESEFEKKPVA